jgi:hypothetical protein
MNKTYLISGLLIVTIITIVVLTFTKKETFLSFSQFTLGRDDQIGYPVINNQNSMVKFPKNGEPKLNTTPDYHGDYLEEMCTLRKKSNPTLLCASIVGQVPRPQYSEDPKLFLEF